MGSQTVPATELNIEIAAESLSLDAYYRQSIASFTVTLLLLVFFESINPPESYIHQFLFHAKHIYDNGIHRYIIPFFTYGQLIGFLPLTLLSELAGKCSYVIAIGICLRIGSSLLHLLGSSAWLLPHQIARSLYGIASASKVAIKTHAYTNLPHEVYVTITGYMRAVNLVAHVMGGFLGFLFYSKKLDWSVAFSVQVASLAIAIIAFLCNVAFCLSRSKATQRIQKISSFKELVSNAWQICKTERTLAAITIWAIVMDSTQLCFQTQKSSLIHAVDITAKSNGLAVAGSRLASAFVAFLIGHFPHRIIGFRLKWLYLASVVISLSIFLAAYSWNVYMVYSSFLIFSVISDAFQCIATAQIALGTPSSLRGWILFGNQFIAIALASLIQLIFGTVLALEIRWIYFGLATIVLSIPIAQMLVSRGHVLPEENAGS